VLNLFSYFDLSPGYLLDIEVVINISFDPLVQVKQVDSTLPCVSAVIDYI